MRHLILACVLSSLVPGWPAYADTRGSYSIDGLPAGSSVVGATRMGYESLRYGQHGRQDQPAAVALGVTARGDSPAGIRPAMHPRRHRHRASTPVRSSQGTVLDEHDEPVQGGGVSARLLHWSEGRTTMVSPVAGPSISTDDRGRYRLAAIGCRLSGGLKGQQAVHGSCTSRSATRGTPTGRWRSTCG